MKKLLLGIWLSVCCYFFSVPSYAQIIIRVAGDTIAGHTGDGASAVLAELNQPFSLVKDALGNKYIGEGNGADIRKVDGSGTITTFAGTGALGYFGDGGPATAAKIGGVSGMTFDAAGNMIIADFANDCIRKINMTTGTISLVAGTGGTSGSTGDGGPATAALFNHLMDVKFDATGNLYISDWGNNKIRMINTSGDIVLIAGTGTAGYTGDGFAATAAEISAPYKLAFDATGNLFFADGGNNCVRKVDITSGIITTVVGTGTSGFFGDGGPATSARLASPSGVAFDANGNLYIADRGNARIRVVDGGGMISSIAGTGIPAGTGDGGPATAARFNSPFVLMTDPDLNLYIGDINGMTVREIIAKPVAAFTAPASLCADSCTTLTKGGTGTLDSLTWSIPGITLASPHSATINPCFPGPGTYSLNLNVYNISGSDVHSTSIVVNPQPHPHVLSGGFVSVPALYTSYQWYGLPGGIISGATSNSYFGSIGGYYVIVDSGGCAGKSDSGFIFEAVHEYHKDADKFWLTQTSSNSLEIYSREVLAEPLTISIRDQVGRQVLSDTWMAGSSSTNIRFGDISPGLYVIRLSNGASPAVLKWMKQ